MPLDSGLLPDTREGQSTGPCAPLTAPKFCSHLTSAPATPPGAFCYSDTEVQLPLPRPWPQRLSTGRSLSI